MIIIIISNYYAGGETAMAELAKNVCEMTNNYFRLIVITIISVPLLFVGAICEIDARRTD